MGDGGKAQKITASHDDCRWMRNTHTYTHMTLRSTHAYDKTLIEDRPRHNCVAPWTDVHPVFLRGHMASYYTGRLGPSRLF